MAVEGGMKCVKILIFFFNFLFWICGLALIVVGVLVQLALHNTITIKDASASGAPIVVIGVGVVIFFISFFGCCGAWKENQCMITMFAILLSLLIIVQIGAAIAGYIFRNKLSVIVKDSLGDMIPQYNSSTHFQDTVDKLQKDLKCCGMNNASDWKNFKPDGKSAPDSCCVNATKGCGEGALSKPDVLYPQGCQKALEDFLRKNIQWVIVAALVIALLQVMGIVFACMLLRGIRSGYEVM